MTPAQVDDTLNRLGDGQPFTVTAKSGKTFTGIFDGTKTSTDWLHWDDMNGHPFRAAWENVAEVTFRTGRAIMGGKGFVPPEHPLSKAGPVGLRAHTTRNY